jgi:hypothetical protein
LSKPTLPLRRFATVITRRRKPRCRARQELSDLRSLHGACHRRVDGVELRSGLGGEPNPIPADAPGDLFDEQSIMPAFLDSVSQPSDSEHDRPAGDCQSILPFIGVQRLRYRDADPPPSLRGQRLCRNCARTVRGRDAPRRQLHTLRRGCGLPWQDLSAERSGFQRRWGIRNPV